MNDKYISKVTEIKDSGGLIHHCGTVAVGVEVDCPMDETVLYCPGCDVFWVQYDGYWGDEKTEWAVKKPAPKTNYVELYKTLTIKISSLMEKLKTKDRLLSEAHKKFEALDRKIKILEEEQIEYLETHLQVQEQFNGVMAELRQYYGPNNEVLDEMEKKWLHDPVAKKARPFNNEKIKGMIPDPKVINPLRKKAPLFDK